MARRRSFLSLLGIIGTINGITYYLLKGKLTARKANPPKKNTIYHDPRFVTVKANCLEFGGASVMAKAICTGLSENVKTFKDSYFTSRLTGKFRKIIQKGRGDKGSREADLLNHPQGLIGLQLHKKKVFNQIYTGIPLVSVDLKRSTITIRIVNSNPESLNKYSKSATHFTLTAAVSTVSVHKWHPRTKKYQPVHKAANGLGTTVQSPILLCKIEHPEINLKLNIPKRVPTNVAITVWLGIHFGREQKSVVTPFLTSKAMECIAIL